MTITNISDVERELHAEIDRLKKWAKLGLEALEYASTGNRRAELIAPAIAAFKQALAEQPARQQQEPICKLFGTLPVYDRPEQHRPLTREQVKGLMTEAGYDTASPQERADFINGIRHGEAAHGIKGGE